MRMFLGIAMPETVRARLAEAQGALSGGRLVHPEDFHLTLRFLGEASAFQLKDLEAELLGLEAPAFDLLLRGLGVFGNGHQVRALWAAIAPSPELEHLQGKIERACQQAGFDAERRKFKPHVTLARYQNRHIDDLRTEMEEIDPIIEGQVPVKDIVLFRSFLGGEGPHYQVWQTFPLTDYAALWPEDDPQAEEPSW